MAARLTPKYPHGSSTPDIDAEPCTRTPHSLLELIREHTVLDQNLERRDANVILQELATKPAPSFWDASALGLLKQALIGRANGHGWVRHEDGHFSNGGDQNAVCYYDCYRRMASLEPLVADILRRGVEGDFLEAGVYRGGISIYLAALLRAAGELGRTNANRNGKARRLWLADSFQGLPSREYTSAFAQAGASEIAVPPIGRYMPGKLTGTLQEVQRNAARYLARHVNISDESSFDQHVHGLHYLVGYFNDTLPTAPVERLALLRADSDLFASTFETLEYLYPKLSVGGWVVFDDWKIAQARGAILQYRRLHNITTRVLVTLRDEELRKKNDRYPPGQDPLGYFNYSTGVWNRTALSVFGARDRIAFWRKDAVTG